MDIKSSSKSLAFYFFEKTNQKATPALIARTIASAKMMLKSGYTYEEIVSVINYVIDVQKTEMYSIGYIEVSINAILHKIKSLEVKQVSHDLKREMANIVTEVVHGDTSERNSEKSKQFGVQSRFGEGNPLDMFEES